VLPTCAAREEVHVAQRALESTRQEFAEAAADAALQLLCSDVALEHNEELLAEASSVGAALTAQLHALRAELQRTSSELLERRSMERAFRTLAFEAESRLVLATTAAQEARELIASENSRHATELQELYVRVSSRELAAAGAEARAEAAEGSEAAFRQLATEAELGRAAAVAAAQTAEAAARIALGAAERERSELYARLAMAEAAAVGARAGEAVAVSHAASSGMLAERLRAAAAAVELAAAATDARRTSLEEDAEEAEPRSHWPSGELSSDDEGENQEQLSEAIRLLVRYLVAHAIERVRASAAEESIAAIELALRELELEAEADAALIGEDDGNGASDGGDAAAAAATLIGDADVRPQPVPMPMPPPPATPLPASDARSEPAPLSLMPHRPPPPPPLHAPPRASREEPPTADAAAPDAAGQPAAELSSEDEAELTSEELQEAVPPPPPPPLPLQLAALGEMPPPATPGSPVVRAAPQCGCSIQ
jgi:hypothetical protein